jgi:hypothetical protein
MDLDFRTFLYLCLCIFPLGGLPFAFIFWCCCRVGAKADESLGYKDEE